jgi:hypothetical protein
MSGWSITSDGTFASLSINLWLLFRLAPAQLTHVGVGDQFVVRELRCLRPSRFVARLPQC